MVTGEDIVNEAKKHCGKPWKGWELPTLDYDCSGFVVMVYKNAAGINLPHGTKYLINKGTKVAQKDLKPGDLVFPHPGHVGISMGGNQYIHIPQNGDVVRISTIKKFYTARRILQDN